ncbi:YbjN domain-containing protein [Rhodococcus antarcticus]|uniref:YbjN domain-containing protein n=1 Tax=Rhodococcus antarcticus TaxID=2987751 RepID=A0ABY6P0P8_9NOCA|nr:YbjN domain-containing protein [Rhodococcus antarcticus]UZJ25222.1 YbjN domain-containing protein [Rhodococcus antarcticus]
MSRPGVTALAATIETTLTVRELEFTRPRPELFVVTLPGEAKLTTTCMLTLGAHGLRVEAFVCRQPDENHVGLYAFLLRRNRKLFGVSYTIDRSGDVYLVGRIALESVTEAELDRVLGQVLEAADGDFNTMLELGFATSIRREWAWRSKRGESLRNLAAFAHLVEADRAGGGPTDQ